MYCRAPANGPCRCSSVPRSAVNDAGVNFCDGYDEGVDLRAETTAAKTFDRTYDLTKPPESSRARPIVVKVLSMILRLSEMFHPPHRRVQRNRPLEERSRLLRTAVSLLFHLFYVY